ncbi:MAG: DUF2905 domain-containing protein [Ktedonobacterales bacterium]
MLNLSDLGRALLLVGGAIVVLGLLLLLLLLAGRIPLFGRLPGDITIQRGNTSFYFPIVTCIVLSVVLTVILNLVLWLLRRH